MTTMADFAGYLASTMVLLTFMAKDMRLLRVPATFSDIAFIAFGVLAWLPPGVLPPPSALAGKRNSITRFADRREAPGAAPVLARCHEILRDNVASRVAS